MDDAAAQEALAQAPPPSSEGLLPKGKGKGKDKGNWFTLDIGRFEEVDETIGECRPDMAAFRQKL